VKCGECSVFLDPWVHNADRKVRLRSSWNRSHPRCTLQKMISRLQSGQVVYRYTFPRILYHVKAP
jgi:hypothetical protein